MLACDDSRDSITSQYERGSCSLATGEIHDRTKNYWVTWSCVIRKWFNAMKTPLPISSRKEVLEREERK
jgi:hypothetical protein